MAISSGVLLPAVAENHTFPILSALAYTTGLGYHPTCDYMTYQYQQPGQRGLLTITISLLVRHCDYGPILHRFRDTATYWVKTAYFSYPSLIQRPRSLCSLWNFAVKLSTRKLIMELSCSEDRMIVAWVVLTQCQHVTDRQTDGRTDRQTDEFTIASTALCIASYADAL